MDIYRAPLEDMKFILETFGYGEIAALERFQDYDIETVMQLLSQADLFGREELLPTNRIGDREGLKWDPETGAVTTPACFKPAYKAMVENGYLALSGDPEYGGAGAPESINMAVSDISVSCQKSLIMCPGLTRGLVSALEDHGSDAQKREYMPHLIKGDWTGTMCLTEPQCGTDLGLLRTKAVPFEDHYKVTGTKIWITFGEHDLADNIVHLVLGRLPDAPEGIKGISTFLVPKFKADGTPNHVKCTGLEHKMGIHASPTCVIDMEDAEGWLIGEPHKGMRVMFTMMNGARIHVGMEAISAAEIAYQTALYFAKERRQMRSLDKAKREMDQPADTIIVHPDVRRMLALQKATNEGMRAMTYWGAILIDQARALPDEKAREEAADLSALLTPLIKGYCTDRGFLNTSEAMQTCGGAGFTQDWDIEQYMRDCRITMIYEGTNHIQALDLVGRKLPMNNGRAVQLFNAKVTELIRATKDVEVLKPFVDAFKAAVKELTEVTMELAAKGMENQENAGAVANNYLHLFALSTMAYCWLKMAAACVDREDRFAKAKLKTAAFYFNYVLADRHTLVARIRRWNDDLDAFEVADF